MDGKKLQRYKKNKRDAERLDEAIQKLKAKLNEVPVVSSKVAKSSDDFPYIEQHIQVQVAEPSTATRIELRIQEKERRKKRLLRENVEVENFIDAMPPGNEKDIFEMVFLDGMTQKEAAEYVGYTQGRVSQIIKKTLKD